MYYMMSGKSKFDRRPDAVIKTVPMNKDNRKGQNTKDLSQGKVAKSTLRKASCAKKKANKRY